MKKLIALLLTMIMVCSLVTVAFAAEDTSDGVEASDPKDFTFTKTYETTANAKPATFPTETLNFTITKGAANPDDTMITVKDNNAHVVDANPDTITVSIPSYKKIGVYTYTVAEQDGKTQGVGYAADDFVVTVTATFNDAHTAIETAVHITTRSDTEGSDTNNNQKLDNITNTYDLGSLTVSKNVTGALGSTTKEFSVDVTFTVEAGKEVKSDITYKAKYNDTTDSTIAASEWENGSVTKTIVLKDDAQITFSNIPAGVSYTVKEHDYTTGEVNGDNAYDVPKYSVNNAADVQTKDGISNTIAADDNDTVAITNNKDTVVDTGIVLDSMPYVLILVAAAGSLVVFARKKPLQE